MNSELEENQVYYCDGGDKDYPEHPRISLNVKKGEKISCPYCGKVFICD